MKVKITKAQLRTMIREEFVRASISNTRRAQLRENIVTDAISSLGGGGIDAAQQGICEYLLDRMGLDSNAFLGRVICNAFENMDADEIATIIFGAEEGDPSRCEVLSRNILASIAEALIEKFREEMFPSTEGWAYTAIGRPIEEAITNNIVENSDLINSVSEGLCNAGSSVVNSIRDVAGDVGDMLGGLLSGDDAAEPASPARPLSS